MNKTLTKEEVQQRILKNGKPLDMDRFNWDGKTRTFSSDEYGLVIDFSDIDNCIFKTGSNCVFITESRCTFKTGNECTFNTGSECTFDTKWKCTFHTGAGCTFKTEWDCVFNTEWYCTFNTGADCTFKTGSDCTFVTGASCTFETESNCTFNMWDYGYFNTTKCDNNIVIIRLHNNSKIIKLVDLQNNKLVRLSSKNNPIYRDIKDVKIIDDYTMVVNSTKQLDQYKIHSAYYIYNYFHENNPSKVFIVEQDNLFAHGKSIKEAINDLEFKKLSKLGANEHIQRVIKQGYIKPQDYRYITGACKEGTNKFLNDNNLGYDDTKSIDEVIELTKGNYGHDVFVRLLEENGYENI